MFRGARVSSRAKSGQLIDPGEYFIRFLALVGRRAKHWATADLFNHVTGQVWPSYKFTTSQQWGADGRGGQRRKERTVNEVSLMWPFAWSKVMDGWFSSLAVLSNVKKQGAQGQHLSTVPTITVRRNCIWWRVTNETIREILIFNPTQYRHDKCFLEHIAVTDHWKIYN